MFDASELTAPAFLAGVLMFLAPCTFPLVPAFLGAISGIHSDKRSLRARKELVLNGLLFVLGFTFIFILFGTAVGWGGQFLFPYRRILGPIAGAFIILFGFSLLGVFRAPIFLATTNLRLKIPGIPQERRAVNSFLIGVAFGIGWTPCIGPILGSILLLATTAGSAMQGALLLAVFSLGLAIPFLFVAFAYATAGAAILKLSRAARMIEIISGAFLIFLGYLIFTHQFGLLIGWGYKIFKFINYERLLDYL